MEPADLGVGDAVGWNSDIRFLMVLVTLWRLPPRLGGCSTRLLQLTKESQLVLFSGLATIARKILARWVAQAERADFGICFMTVHSTGVHQQRSADAGCGAVEA